MNNNIFKQAKGRTIPANWKEQRNRLMDGAFSFKGWMRGFCESYVNSQSIMQRINDKKTLNEAFRACQRGAWDKADKLPIRQEFR